MERCPKCGTEMTKVSNNLYRCPNHGIIDMGEKKSESNNSSYIG